jgi:hypothetical protein
MNCYQFIRETFLKLTSKTYPYMFESILLSDCKSLFPKLEMDEFGNYFLEIGSSRTVFASHLDTACKQHQKVNHVITNNIIKTDGTTILGADDKAGVTLMLWLIKNNIPGLYYFFIGEEVGCVGSRKASTLSKFNNYDRIISFDRRGTESVITHQSYTRTCSDEFARSLAKQLNQYGDLKYEIDDTGVYTDSAEFVEVIPECTNISVGYYNEHTVRESQDLNHLIQLALSIVDINWESLPTIRDKNSKEYKEDWTKFEYDSYHEISYREDLNRNRKKRNRRSKKSGKSYMDLGHGEYIEIPKKSDIDRNITNKDFPRYGENIKISLSTKTTEAFIGKMKCNRQISKEELIKLGSMFFDMDNKEDIQEYNYLLSVIW